MTLPELTARAESIRHLYAQRAALSGNLPWTGMELALGFTGDVGELAKLVMAREGRRTTRHQNLDAALEHELADCLWAVLVLAKTYDVDLERAFNRTMNELEQSLPAPSS